MILAGDVGGTKTNLGFFDECDGRLRSVVCQTYASREHASLDELARAFVAQHKLPLAAACFGVAGPVKHGVCRATNLPWVVDARRLAGELNVPHVQVINDLEATAYGVSMLGPDDFAVLYPGAVDAEGNAAVIAAGTGLGEAGLLWDGKRHRPFACEGGHTDFSPRDDLEIELLRFLRQRFGRASWERVLSGPGVHNLYDFFYQRDPSAASPEVADQIAHGDAGAAIGTAAREHRCPACVQAVDLFCSLYGSEAGNLALKMMATGGVYLGGGIAPKELDFLERPQFVQSFLDKGRMRLVLEEIPVRVILAPEAALLGAARCAQLAAP